MTAPTLSTRPDRDAHARLLQIVGKAMQRAGVSVTQPVREARDEQPTTKVG